jgi:nicotinamide riboside transporter PnuC
MNAENIFMLHLLPWTLTLVSITGAILNVLRKRASFFLYTVANIGWICINIYHSIYAQATLFAVFTGLSIWGWIEWGKQAEKIEEQGQCTKSDRS